MLLILGCSSRKKIYRGPRPYHQVYDGTFWRVARSRHPSSNIAAISAKYGVLLPGDEIEDYDLMMDEKIANSFIADREQMDRLAKAIREEGSAFVCAGAPYQMLVNYVVEKDRKIKSMVKFSHGTIDKMCKQLTQVLDQEKKVGFFRR